MFSLHETTQRMVCRVLFILCAAVPLVVTIAFILYSLRPWREADWQESLSQQLHVQAVVEAVFTPRPGVQELKNVRIADLRSQLPLLQVDKIRASWEGDKLLLRIGSLQLQQAHLGSLASTLSTVMSAKELPPVKLDLGAVLLQRSQGRRLYLSNAQLQVGQWKASRRLVKVEADLVNPDQVGPQPMLHLEIVQQGATLTTSLDTGGARLPTWVLTELWPSLAGCPESTFAGRIELEGNCAELKGSLHGRIEHIDFARWMGDSSPHQFTGVGHLVLDDFQWSNKRVDVAHGSLQSSGGSISRQLVSEMQQRLFCNSGPSALNSAEATGDLSFDELSCGFHLTAKGLTLTGRCQSIRDGAPGCMLVSRGEALLLEPTYPNLPVAQLVQALSHPATSWLPASREAHEMAGSLPLPPADSTKKEVAAQPKDSTSR